MREWIRKLQGFLDPRVNGAAPTPAAPAVAATSPRPRAIAGKYASLYQYLEHRYADVVVLTFAQIEDLLGFALPALARTQKEWWTPSGATADPPVYAEAWTMAGRTAVPNLAARTVLFERGAV